MHSMHSQVNDDEGSQEWVLATNATIAEIHGFPFAKNANVKKAYTPYVSIDQSIISYMSTDEVFVDQCDSGVTLGKYIGKKAFPNPSNKDNVFEGGSKDPLEWMWFRVTRDTQVSREMQAPPPMCDATCNIEYKEDWCMSCKNPQPPEPMTGDLYMLDNTIVLTNNLKDVTLVFNAEPTASGVAPLKIGPLKGEVTPTGDTPFSNTVILPKADIQADLSGQLGNIVTVPFFWANAAWTELLHQVHVKSGGHEIKLQGNNAVLPFFAAIMRFYCSVTSFLYQ